MALMLQVVDIFTFLEAFIIYLNDKVVGLPRDIRTKDWFLTEYHLPGYVILFVYLIFCLYAGPNFMKDRKPYDLKKIMFVYNALQVVLSCVLVYEFIQSGWNGHNSFRCQPVSFESDPISLRMARAMWLYYIAKLTELLDTVFFILRKRDRQVTFLHLYHHTTMPMATLTGVQYYAGGHASLACLVNSFIHVIMYTYYMLAAMGPKIQKYLWWKKYITLMQIVQFVIVFVHNIQLHFQPDCTYSKTVGYILSIDASIFIYMFSSFYIKSYRDDQKTNKANALKED